MKYSELKEGDVFSLEENIYLKHKSAIQLLYPDKGLFQIIPEANPEVHYIGSRFKTSNTVPEKSTYLFDLGDCVIDLRKVLWILKTEDKFKIVFNCHIEGQNLINIEMKYWEPLKAAWEKVVTNDKV